MRARTMLRTASIRAHFLGKSWGKATENECTRMRMDHTQRGWALGSLALLATSAAAYVIYVLQSPAGPSGGSFMGLMFGIVGFAFMIFAALLGARKRVPTWR